MIINNNLIGDRVTVVTVKNRYVCVDKQIPLLEISIPSTVFKSLYRGLFLAVTAVTASPFVASCFRAITCGGDSGGDRVLLPTILFRKCYGDNHLRCHYYI